MSNLVSSRTKINLEKLTDDLIDMELPTPKCVMTFFHKRVEPSIGRGYEFADVITVKHGLLFQRLFCFQLHGGERPASVKEIGRRYEGGKIIVSNLMQSGMLSPYLADDSYGEGHTSGWCPSRAFKLEKNAKNMFLYPRFHLNEKEILQKFPYSGWNEYSGNLDLFKYLTIYKQNPSIEYLVKSGYSNYISSISSLNQKGRNFEEIFGVSRKFKEYLKIKGISQLRLIRKYTWLQNGDEVDRLADLVSCERNHKQHYVASVGYVNYEKLNERDMKYLVRNKISLSQYRDYIGFAEKCGYPLEEARYRYPKNFLKAHDEAESQMYVIQNKEKDEKIAELNKKYAKYAYEKNGLCIFPVKDSQELIKESQELHHCVRTYIDKVANGQSCIFFIRRTERPEVPYVTLELKGKSSNAKKLDYVSQCYAEHDTEPSDEVKEFVRTWERKYKFDGIYA